MPLFKRTPKPLPPPESDLPAGEEIERSLNATMLYGKQAIAGGLYLTNRRLLFEARKGAARYMVVPFDEAASAGLYPWPGATMGMPSSRRQCLVVETTMGEQVWWDFDEQAEREWLPVVRAHIEEAKAAAATDAE